MPVILRYVLALLAGLVAGAAVNMGLVMISGSVIPPPEGVDVTSTESLKASIHLFKPKHFLMPFLAHALGTLVGAFTAARLAPAHSMRLALIVGLFFFAGGMSAVFMLPAPAWFNVLDLVAAYFPMAWLGGRLGRRTTTTA